MDLLKYKDEILKSQSLNQRLYYVQSHWLGYDYGNTALSKDISFICSRFNDGISRAEVIKFMQQPDTSLRQGFLLSMIWGHGSSKHGRADNRGPWKVGLMAKDLQLLDEVLLKSRDLMLLGNIQGAHEVFKPISRCRVNFFSKFLYFMGRAEGISHYPLIFDARVAQSMIKISLSNTIAHNLVLVSPKQDALSFKMYVDMIHEQANKIDVSPEEIEYFLFASDIS
jgi:hypothetical protein